MRITLVACLSIGLALAADNGSSQTRPAIEANERPALRSADITGGEPLPIQVWPISGKDGFLVSQSGNGKIVELAVAATPVIRARPDLRFPAPRFAAPAPNGRFWASIDPGLPVVKIFEGNFPGPDVEAKNHAPSKAISCDPNPQALVITPDSKLVLVACDATGPADRRIALVDVASGKATYRTVPRSSNLRGIAVDPAGKFALAAHLVHKSHLPSTQIEQGWVFTNAVTYLSLDGPQVSVTLPLDLRTQGFANPEGIAIAADGSKAYVAHAGADVVSVIDLAALADVVAARARGGDDEPAAGEDGRGLSSNVYRSEDLRVTRRYVRARIRVGANPRGIAVSADGKFVAVANRLDDSISIIDSATEKVTTTISLGPAADPRHDQSALVREGERLFHSGGLAFSGQFSCASCHPDGHADGLNWDLPADGFNNFHNTKSLLSVNGTAPYGWLGTSPTLRDRFTGTLRHLFQHEPTARETAALEAYLSRLTVEQPRAPTGRARENAVARGKAQFEGQAGCTACHSGPKFTDRARHDIGTGSAGEAAFDTPALLRISTTAPYLHDGRATTLGEIFTKYNPGGLHGHADELSGPEQADLFQFLESL